jgi:long-chain acyl-CoA synthetase
MPIFHSNSTWFSQILVLMGGSMVVYRSGGFDPEEVLSLISRERITLISVVPTMLTMILNLPDSVKARYDVSSMKAVLAGSAPLMTRTKEQTIEFFKNALLFEGYGSTETGMVTVLRPEDQLRKVRSVGIAAAGKEIRLLDDQGKDVPPGSVGEVYARGLGILLVEYWKDPQATAKAFRGDWCTVGDMGRIDGEGYYYLEDRKADMIISGGENVYPTEVENVLAKHPAVLESAVVALPDQLWGEKVHAVVVLKEGRKATAEELMNFCRDKLAGYKRPRSVDFLEELPKSSTGKILRRKVREAYWGEKKLYF